MFKTLSIFILGLLMAVGLAVAGPVTSAQAAAQYTTPWECVNYRNVTTCEYVGWRAQSDGTGVVIEGFHVWTSNGCGSLEDSGGKYNPARAFFPNPDTETVYQDWDWGAEDCNWAKDLSYAGRDVGTMDFRSSIKARINLAGDKIVDMGWTLHPLGGYSYNYGFASDAS